jgi:TPP-dependent pyruvate/acetoin dehydrogenase alpha subunit/pyruvate/2-oxoglutarate/acetoin dehydrogenase E1 component
MHAPSFATMRQPTKHSIAVFSSLSKHSFSSSSYLAKELSDLTPAWAPFESSHGSTLRALDEFQAVDRLKTFLKARIHHEGRPNTPVPSDDQVYMHTLSSSQHLNALDAAIATFSLHVHARMASLVGKGFYTIGPCGEELLAAGGMAFEEDDATALHYRHTAMSVARQLDNGNKSLDEILLARARGYTVSRHDPVTGGVHCSIGGGPNEYLVTSTLSSQCPPAVGRALGYSLLSQAGIHHGWQKDQRENLTKSKPPPISFTTVGDGSLHNHHFLSAFTLARHAKHMKIKCPIVFGISNNGLSISYETKNYLDTVFNDKDSLVPVFRANGQDMQSVFDQTKQACDYARHYQSPCVLLYSNMVRRFGHAATDRQDAYLDEERIQSMVDTCVLETAIQDAVEKWNVTTYAQVLDRLEEIHFQAADRAFAQAMNEPKVTLEDMMDRVSAPLATPRPTSPSSSTPVLSPENNEKPQVLRKHMTRFYDELMAEDPTVVYLGEDVRHGGYYLVTECLADKYPNRVLDFPPDETTLLGAALGFAQLGLTPIVEIPYAKYLDCGADMFNEIAIQHWLSSSAPDNTENHSKSGMIVRLQGFDRGLFGGNFHTHNMLSHMPPGVDVVCFSNGRDYVHGMRHALLQAKAGRVVMVVDCTHLLNLRHLEDRDRQWEFPYPADPNELLLFDQIRCYKADEESEDEACRAIVTYGNGVVTALQTRNELLKEGIIAPGELDVIDCPYLSGLPSELEEALKTSYEGGVLFADICKEGVGSNVFSSMIMSLQQRNSLPSHWAFVGAPRTYNPLGSTVTFLNRDTIRNAFVQMQDKSSVLVVDEN